ncbi:MAG: hypothetical protein WCD35_08250 [Mycobacteriales bacterium]
MTEPAQSRPAGEGLSDEEMAAQVAQQTSGDLAVEEAFAREADGATSETAAAEQLD